MKKCRCEKKRKTKNGFYILDGYGLGNVFIHNYNYKNEIWRILKKLSTKMYISVPKIDKIRIPPSFFFFSKNSFYQLMALWFAFLCKSTVYGFPITMLQNNGRETSKNK